MRLCFLVLAASSLAIAACGGRVEESSSSAEDASISVDSAIAMNDAGATPTADADSRDPLKCPGLAPIGYDKRCKIGADCVIAYVDEGCCTIDALGVSKSDFARFTDAAAGCANLDPCDCAGDKTIADDGRTSIDPMHRDVVVECNRGECETRIE